MRMGFGNNYGNWYKWVGSVHHFYLQSNQTSNRSFHRTLESFRGFTAIRIIWHNQPHKRNSHEYIFARVAMSGLFTPSEMNVNVNANIKASNNETASGGDTSISPHTTVPCTKSLLKSLSKGVFLTSFYPKSSVGEEVHWGGGGGGSILCQEHTILCNYFDNIFVTLRQALQ